MTNWFYDNFALSVSFVSIVEANDYDQVNFLVDDLHHATLSEKVSSEISKPLKMLVGN